MQPNTIALTHVSAHTEESVTRSFNRIEDDVPNRSTYCGPNYSLVSKDTLQMYRTYPKRSGEYLGAAKFSVKMTRDQTVPNASGADAVYPLIVNTDTSVPIGTDPKELEDILREQSAAIVAAHMEALRNRLDV